MEKTDATSQGGCREWVARAGLWGATQRRAGASALRSASATSLSPLLVLQMKLSRPNCVRQHVSPGVACLGSLPVGKQLIAWSKSHPWRLWASQTARQLFVFSQVLSLPASSTHQKYFGSALQFQPHKCVLFHDYFLIIALGKTALGPVPNHVPGMASYIQDGVFG